MTSAHATVVVVHSVEVVDERLGLADDDAALLRKASLDLVAFDELLHVEPLDREVDKVVEDRRASCRERVS